MSVWILGLATSGHDPALAIANPAGEIVFAEATERFLQDKRAWGIAPDHIGHLAEALAETDFVPGRDTIAVATSWASAKAELKRGVHDAMLPAPDTIWMQGMQLQLQESAGASLLRLGLASERPSPMRFDHHLTHAVTACYFAPTDTAACLVIDGEGDVGASSSFTMKDRELTREWRSWGPGSLGTFYGWLTQMCGFDWRLGEEWKVMGLAAYGSPNPELVENLKQMLIVDRGRLRFAADDVLLEIRKKAQEFGRRPDEPVEKAAVLAASGQAAYAALADLVLGEVASQGHSDLVLSGGCALNSSYNGTIAGRLPFERVFVPPCPADDGNAIGAALLGWMKVYETPRIPVGNLSPFLGSRAKPKGLDRLRKSAGRGLVVCELDDGDSAQVAAEFLAQGKILGVMRGRAEFGPRALGNRSILADPRSADMKDRINALVKGRESYRPFAPVVPHAKVAEWFGHAQPVPYMSMTLPWREEAASTVPAVVHEDCTGRVQTVTSENAPWLNAVVEAFEGMTGVPIVLNTSFNIMGKPIVHSVEDAIAVLMTSGLDGVLIENTLVTKPD
ncbi:carbamoyltransferase family protein [Roseibium suaedae]|uniref:Carbamoyltransferase n=1 Tax=Roseibium suaedae TaxID=735517 RepID=A0A1M7P5U1_9HYPH|nr:carbamoyltransferase C-terminal domain-containing protein [Roseibium suaedae]SHN11722.1 carbamoyltransferase [Roseibium suaedae]